jgi:hypothetical protein
VKALRKTKGFDSELYSWFVKKRNKHHVIHGPDLQSMALRCAEKLGILDFKASQGWLEKFKRRWHIKSAVLNGESGFVDETKIVDFREKYKRILTEYDLDDIYNFDETGLFIRNLNNKSLDMKKSYKKII